MEMDNRLQPSLDSGNSDVPGKTAVRGSLTLRNYDGQVAEAMALVMSAEQMTKAGMPGKRAYCLKTQPATGKTYPKSDLFNKAHLKPKRFTVGEPLWSISGCKIFHYLNKCLRDRFFFMVMPILNHPASASHHRGNGIR